MKGKSTSSPAERLANRSASQGNSAGLPTRAGSCHRLLHGWLTGHGRRGCCGRTSSGRCGPTKAAPSRRYSSRSPGEESRLPSRGGKARASSSARTEGTASHGACWTANMCEWPDMKGHYLNSGDVCGLWDIAESGPPLLRYLLAPRASRQCLDRYGYRRIPIPPLMREALATRSASQATSSGATPNQFIHRQKAWRTAAPPETAPAAAPSATRGPSTPRASSANG